MQTSGKFNHTTTRTQCRRKFTFGQWTQRKIPQTFHWGIFVSTDGLRRQLSETIDIYPFDVNG